MPTQGPGAPGRPEALRHLVEASEIENGAIEVAELDAFEDKLTEARRAAKAVPTGRCQSGSKRRFMSGATFDTAMLVALDRNEREACVVRRRLVSRRELPTVPTMVTTQAWRDGRHKARLAQVLAYCRPEVSATSSPGEPTSFVKALEPPTSS